MPDVTAEVPLRRMSVVRGTLRAAWVHAPDVVAHLAAARLAALLAAKNASGTLPGVPPFQLTDATLDADAGDGVVAVTCTVQAYARTPLAAVALLAAAAALASLARDLAAPQPAIAVELIQDVDG